MLNRVFDAGVQADSRKAQGQANQHALRRVIRGDIHHASRHAEHHRRQGCLARGQARLTQEAHQGNDEGNQGNVVHDNVHHFAPPSVMMMGL